MEPPRLTMPGHPAGGQRHVGKPHPGVDGEVVHPLLGTARSRCRGRSPRSAPPPGRPPSPGPGRWGPCRPGPASCGSIHSRVVWMSGPVERSITVSAPQRVAQTSFSTSSSIGGPDGRVADVGVHLHQEVAADGHRLRLGMVDVGRDDGPPARPPPPGRTPGPGPPGRPRSTSPAGRSTGGAYPRPKVLAEVSAPGAAPRDAFEPVVPRLIGTTWRTSALARCPARDQKRGGYEDRRVEG